MSVVVALAVPVSVNAPLFSRLSGCLYLREQLRRIFYFCFKQVCLSSLREEENSMSIKKAGQKVENKREQDLIDILS